VVIGRAQRFTKQHRCPICGGSEGDTRGRGERCFGFLSDDGLWAHCSRENYAGDVTINPSSSTYAHRLNGACRCEIVHSNTQPNTNDDKPNSPKQIVAAYDYKDRHEKVVFQVVRYQPKRFAQRHPDSDGDWHWGLGGDPSRCGCPKIAPILYRLPELLESDPSQTVFITEGEKQSDVLWEAGLVATTFPMGAGKSHLVRDLSALEGRHVAILPDNDGQGRTHAHQIAERLYGS
jgi:hypothetical protein